MFDSASTAQPSERGGGRVGVVTNVVVYESIKKGQKKLCFAYLTDNPLGEKFSRWILANLSSFHTKRCYRKARLLQKNLLLKIIKYTHHPKKTTLSLLKQHYTVLECYNAYLDKEKQQAWVIYYDDCSGEVSSEQVLI